MIVIFNDYFCLGRYFERGGLVHNALLRPYDQLPSPDSPKLEIALENSYALQAEYGTPMVPRFSLPDGITMADCGRKVRFSN